MKNKKLLIVEDEFVVANDLKMILEKHEYTVAGIAHDYTKAIDILTQCTVDLALVDIHLRGELTGLRLAEDLNNLDIPFVYVSANTNVSVIEKVKETRPYGFIVKPFRERDVMVALEIAYHQHAHRLEARLRKEQALELAIVNELSASKPWGDKLLSIAKAFQPFIPFDYVIMGLEWEKMINTFRSTSFFRVGRDEYQVIDVEKFVTMAGITQAKLQELAKHKPENKLGIFNAEAFEEVCKTNKLKQLVARTFKLQSNLILPLQTTHNGIFYLSFFSRNPVGFNRSHYELLQRMSTSLTLAVDRLIAFEKIEFLSDQLKQENKYLQEEVKTTANYDEIVGKSESLHRILDDISQVAQSDYTVLILGETGTGKELIARAVHNASTRRNKALVKVNCAALPTQLIESELFGHEKGSFTGAMQTRIGKFELANNGTIFLDEIGEMPLELQSKLLRVLQEKEIERVGGNQSIACDVRIIAATNRNLREEVAAGKFRADLFYRLNVFPISLPPLRERKEDIEPLTEFFLHKISKKLGKEISGVSHASLLQMKDYAWPGNIRELEHMLERAAITSKSPVLSLVEYILVQSQAQPAYEKIEPVVKPQSQVERENILAALRLSDYRIRGKGGAAEILNLKPTTLEAKMARMGIHRNS